MSVVLETKLGQLPKAPGVYFHKDSQGEIIYVGKAAVLRQRVRQYFQAARGRDAKTAALVAEIADTDWMVVESEVEALFLEAEMIRRYLPRYNILLREDKALAYIRIDYDSDYPTVRLTRQPRDDGARYFGPYLSAGSIGQALTVLRRVFPFATGRPKNQKRMSLSCQIGLDPGLEYGKTSLQDYRATLRKLMVYIQGKGRELVHTLKREMKQRARAQDFEGAARLRDQLFALRDLNQQVVFSAKEFSDLGKDHALGELVQLLGLSRFPERLEAYDVFQAQEKELAGSMVVFTNGVPSKTQYRKFKLPRKQRRAGTSMHETLRRRLCPRNVKAWGSPGLVLIAGGPEELAAATQACDEQGWNSLPVVGLGREDGQMVLHKGRSNVTLQEQAMHALGGQATAQGDFIFVELPPQAHGMKLLQRIREESQRFIASCQAEPANSSTDGPRAENPKSHTRSPKSQTRNPKSEGRNPKEARRPKSEWNLRRLRAF